jgi:hypothetical protein
MKNVRGEKEVEAETARATTVEEEAKVKVTANEEVVAGMENIEGEKRVEVGTAKANIVEEGAKAKSGEGAKT